MRIRPIVLAAAFLAAVAMATPVLAEDAKTPSPAQLSEDSAKVQLASGLIAMGRANKDPMMLAVALKLLAGLDAPVVDPQSAASGSPKDYDLAAIAEEAKALAAGDEAALAQITAVPMSSARSGERYCAWDWQCNAIDCGWVYACGW